MADNKIKIFLIVLIVLFSFGCKQHAEISDNSFQIIENSGTLILGTYAGYVPVSFIDNSGNIVGHDIDVAKEIARRLELDLEIKNIFFANLFNSLEKGEIDIAMSTITITSERAKRVLFSVPYLDGGQVLIVRNDTEDFNLEESKVGVQCGTTSEITTKEFKDQSLVISHDNFSRVLLYLKEGNVDIVISDYIGAVPSVKKEPSLKIVGSPITREYYAVATRKDNTALMEKINKILREMKRDGTLGRIRAKWLA